MKHILRRYSMNLLAAISLVLCAAVIAVWADSYRETRMVEHVRGQQIIKWASRDGVAVIRWDGPPDGHWRWQRPTEHFQIMGFSYIDGRLVRRKPWSMLVVPYWMPALLTAVIPIVWVMRRFHQHVAAERIAAGLCPACGTRIEPDHHCV